MIHVEIFRRTSKKSGVLKAKSHNLSGLLWLADVLGKTEVPHALSSLKSCVKGFINIRAA